MNSPKFDAHRDAWFLDGKEVSSIYLDEGRWYLPETKDVALICANGSVLWLKERTAKQVLREANNRWLISRHNMVFGTNWSETI